MTLENTIKGSSPDTITITMTRLDIVEIANHLHELAKIHRATAKTYEDVGLTEEQEKYEDKAQRAKCYARALIIAGL